MSVIPRQQRVGRRPEFFLAVSLVALLAFAAPAGFAFAAGGTGTSGFTGTSTAGSGPSSFTGSGTVGTSGGGDEGSGSDDGGLGDGGGEGGLGTVGGSGMPGMTVESVRRLQADLARLGYFHHAVTGFYGLVTTGAVRRFQRSAGLKPDGLWGPRSAAALARRIGRG